MSVVNTSGRVHGRRGASIAHAADHAPRPLCYDGGRLGRGELTPWLERSR